MSTTVQAFMQYPVVPLFLVANVAIGVWAYRQSRSGSFEDYALAGRSLPTAVLTMTVLATMVSNHELVVLDCTFQYGVMFAIITFFQFILPVVLIVRCILPGLVFFKGSTFGSCMREMYGGWTQVLAGAIQIIFSIGVLSTQLVTMGIVAHRLLHIDAKVFVLFFGVTVVLYSALGGMRSVSYTDVLQLVAVLGVFFLVTQKAMLKVGGVESLMRQVATEYPEKLAFFSHPDLWLRIKADLYWNTLSFAYILSPPIVHRMLILKEPRTLTKMWYATSFLYTIVVGMVALIGLFAVVHQGSLGLGEGGNVLVHVVQYLFADRPWMVHGVMVGMMGMLMSTMDSYLHTLGIICVEDVLGPWQTFFKNKGLQEGRQVMWARMSILVMGVVAIVIAWQMNEVGPRFVIRKLINPLIAIQTVVMIPFILGAMGLKPDRGSFISFAVTYLGCFYGQKGLLPWRSSLGHRADDVYFLVALPLGVVAYLVAHVCKYRGFAIMSHGVDTRSKRVRALRWGGVRNGVRWVWDCLNLVRWARREGVYRPMQPLGFSMVMFAVYALHSLLDDGRGGEGLPEFMAVMYMIGMVLCCGLMLQGMWPRSWKPYFSVYWLATLWYCLPLGGTITFLRMHEGVESTYFFAGSFVLLALLVTGRTFFWMGVSGLLLAHAGWYVLEGAFPADLWGSGLHGGAWLVLAVLSMVVWVFGDEVERHVTHRLYVNQALAGAVTDEVVDPLQDTCDAWVLASGVNQSLTPVRQGKGDKGFFLSEASRLEIMEVSELVEGAIIEIRKAFGRYKELLEHDISRAKEEKVGMRKVINDALPEVAKRYQGKLDIKVQCEQDFEAYVLTDLFDTVLRHLVKNAYRHGAATKVEIVVDGVHRKVYVRDNGAGISPDIVPRVFDLGFTTTSSDSYGIGLALVRLILDVVEAKIFCQSRRGEKEACTTFVMTFPRL